MLDYAQLEALLAIEEQGSFAGAARTLRMSSFAISQRIKLLEQELGVVLIERKPTRASVAGKVLCDHARHVRELESDLLGQHFGENQTETGHEHLHSIAVNEECLSSWFNSVLRAQIGNAEAIRIEIVLADSNVSMDLMQAGKVVAGISHRKLPVRGFESYALPNVDYVPVAGPNFIESHLGGAVSAETLAKAPCLRLGKDNRSALDWMELVFGRVPQLSLFKHPSIAGAINMCLHGRAWAVVPFHLVSEHLETGALIELLPGKPLSYPLFWHVSGALSEGLRQLTSDVRAAATFLNKTTVLRRIEDS